MIHPDNSKSMVFGIGFHKTGTSTLRDALSILGYKVKDTSKSSLIPVLKGNWAHVYKKLKNYDAAEDFPWFMIYEKLDELFPGSKYILTIREDEDWYTSISKHTSGLVSANHEWICGRGKGQTQYFRENTLNTYRNHNQKVIEYFKDRPGDLLIIDFTKGEGWEKLCPFLNKKVPETQFPHANKTTFKKKRYKNKLFKKTRRQITNNLKIWYIDQKGLW